MASTGFAAAGVAVLGLACSSVYSSKGAETLPANQIGVLEHDNPVQSDIVIQSVDGEWRGAGAKTTYRLTPGPHALEVIVRSNGSQSSVRWFDVKPGRVYSVERRPCGRQVGLLDRRQDQRRPRRLFAPVVSGLFDRGGVEIIGSD